MVGTLRLVLAIIVVMFHATFTHALFVAGCAAVMVFYMISGYAMTGLAANLLGATAGRARSGTYRFWLDRLLRLYPSYLFWLAVAAIVRFPLHHVWLSQQGPVTAFNLAANFTIIPLPLFELVPGINSFMLLPQGWTLGTEFAFYALFPVIFRYRPVAWAAALTGGGVMALAMLGYVPSVSFAYRILPGPLTFFLLGHALFRNDRAMMAVLLAAVAAASCAVFATGKLHLGVNLAILLATAVGFPALVAATRVRAWRYDHILGHASYGTYLCHMPLVIYDPGIFGTVFRVPAFVILSVAGGVVSHLLVERPANRLRYALRSRAAQRIRGPEPPAPARSGAAPQAAEG